MLPVAFTTTRPYIRVQSSNDPLHPDDVARSLPRLHHNPNDRPAPTYEWLFAATGNTGPSGDRHLEWYVGTDGPRAPLKRALRQSLPESVDLVDTESAYQDALDDPIGPDDDWSVAGVEWQGVGDRPADWQCPLPTLGSFAGTSSPGDWPLASLLDALATTDANALVQLLVTPKPDWTATKEDRCLDLELNSDLRRHALGQALFGTRTESDHASPGGQSDRPSRAAAENTPTGRQPSPHGEDATVHPANRRRIDALRTVDAQRTFVVNARAITIAADDRLADRAVDVIAPGFQSLRGDHYRVTPAQYPAGSDDATALLAALCQREVKRDPTRRRHLIPGTQNASPAIVADPAAVGCFCCVDGPALGPAASRALEPTPTDRTGIELPPRTVLDRYLDQPGMTVGTPLTADRRSLAATLSLPPAVQPLHTALFGTTGAGKTTVGQTMQLTNHAATDGATIYIDAKGDDAPEQYARTHFTRYGDLEDVHYFDCTEYLPGLPFLTIEPLLEAGLDREWAVNTVAEHYIDLLAAAMGPEQFYSAEAAVDVIQQLVRALFDPVHGADKISQQALLAAAAQFHETGNPPSVSDGSLHQKLASTAANAPTTFDSIMSAVTRRLGTATNDARLAPLFEAHTEASRFDLRTALDEDCVIVFDLRGYGDRSRTLLAVAVLSQLWRALRRRQAAMPDGATPPLVNCYIEEAADLAPTGILDTLLAQGRAFDLAVTLAMQFPEQLRDSHPRVYAELLNDVGTIITGSVGVDDRLAERLATSDRDADAVAARLRDLKRGEWLVRPAAPFADRKPQPFQVASPPLPDGHPERHNSPDATAERRFERAFEAAKARTREHHGVGVGDAASGSTDPTTVDGPRQGSATTLAAATETIPHTERFPDCLTYLDEPPYPLVCPTCETRYASTADGIRRAITCHHSLDDVDRANIPVCSLDLQLTSGERAASQYSDAQLRLLAAVYMAHQQRFDPTLEYDIVWDSMTHLEAYVGIDTSGVQALLDDGLLRVDCRRPHKLYTVTPEGRDAIGVGHREGIAYGDGTGDLSESSLHVAMVEVGAPLLAQEHVGPDKPGTCVERYYGVDDGRLDAAVLDADGTVVATLEAERINNDRGEAIPRDFDKMAACNPDHAWWLVKTRGDAHQILQALHDPANSEPRVPRTYSENMAPREYRLDTPGLTDVTTFEYARDTLLHTDGPG